MKKLIFSFALVLFLSIASQAQALTIDTIGSSSTTTGNPGSEWYYTAANPTFTGTSNPSDTVTFTIDGSGYTTTANSAGAWSYTPTTLTTGTHSVVVADSTNSFSFSMDIGSSSPTSGSTGTKGGASGSAQTLPVSGSLENTLMLLGAGAVMVALGLKLQYAKAE